MKSVFVDFSKVNRDFKQQWSREKKDSANGYTGALRGHQVYGLPLAFNVQNAEFC